MVATGFGEIQAIALNASPIFTSTEFASLVDVMIAGMHKIYLFFFYQNFSGLGTAVSFGIHCCPASRNIPIGMLNDCGWVSGGTGEDIECPKVILLVFQGSRN